MSKYFYEKSRFSEFKSNTTYHQLLEMTDDEFVKWARLLRKEVTEQCGLMPRNFFDGTIDPTSGV